MIFMSTGENKQHEARIETHQTLLPDNTWEILLPTIDCAVKVRGKHLHQYPVILLTKSVHNLCVYTSQVQGRTAQQIKGSLLMLMHRDQDVSIKYLVFEKS